MILKQKENLPTETKQALKDYVYDIVGCIMEVTRELPCALPEYIYQEALAKVLAERGINFHKEFRHHPVFHGEPMEAFLKMDIMIERERGNIIIECKAIDKISAHERQQLFSYMIATGFPIGILVNFANYPHPYIERYYFDKSDMTLTAF